MGPLSRTLVLRCRPSVPSWMRERGRGGERHPYITGSSYVWPSPPSPPPPPRPPSPHAAATNVIPPVSPKTLRRTIAVPNFNVLPRDRRTSDIFAEPKTAARSDSSSLSRAGASLINWVARSMKDMVEWW